jgi:hypothetical protein
MSGVSNNGDCAACLSGDVMLCTGASFPLEDFTVWVMDLSAIDADLLSGWLFVWVYGAKALATSAGV